jgi:hypothetical protein
MRRRVRAILFGLALLILGGIALSGCGDDGPMSPRQPNLGGVMEKPGADRPTGAHGGSNN